VALSLASAGLLSMPNTLVVVLGTGTGSAVNILILSSKLKGTAKQLCFYQGLFKFTGVILVALLLGLEYLRTEGGKYGHILSMITDEHGQQIAFVFLAMQLLPAFILTIARTPVKKLLQRLSPATIGDRLAEPEFISNLAPGEPETALYLVAKEQMRLMRLLPDYLVTVSPDRMISPGVNRAMLHEGFTGLDRQIIHYLDKVAARADAASFHEEMMNTKQFSSLLTELETTIAEFASIADSSQGPVMDQPLAIRLIESLRTILETSIESFEDPDPSGLEIIRSITADKGDLLRQVRQEFFQKNTLLEQHIRQSLYSMTILFDRICWLLHKMSVTAIR
jgi:phosphate:Na+ symporter